MISNSIREDFPVFEKEKELIYLDNAATTLKPKQVIDEIMRYYSEFPANVGRGSHKLARQATYEYEEARKKVASFIGGKEEELIFTKNATESINNVAVSLERAGYFESGNVVISRMEHHANLIPWQKLCERKKMELRVVELNENYTLNMSDLEEKVDSKTKMVALPHISNTVASLLEARDAAKIAHDAGAKFLLDAAQSVPHLPINVKKIEADFAAFSAHKMLGPTGIGALYVKEKEFEKMEPYNYGGAIIKKVEIKKTVFDEGRKKFEAGTMHIAGALGFKAAVEYLTKIGLENIHEHEKKLTEKAIQGLENSGIIVHCPKDVKKQGGIVLFECEGIDPVDFGVALDESANIAIRTGMHCAEPIVSTINPQGLARASFYFYNTLDEINTFTELVKSIAESFR